jgi:hypothetical protein
MAPRSFSVQMASSEPSVVVVTPVSRSETRETDILMWKQSQRVLARYPRMILAPRGLDVGEHAKAGDADEVRTLDSEWFESIHAFNALMLSTEFLDAFAEFAFILIHELDAFVFRNDLPRWLVAGYDYVGAPFWADYGLRKEAGLVGVGNGGLSLRNTRAARSVLEAGDRVLSSHPLRVRLHLGARGRAARYLRGARTCAASDVFWGSWGTSSLAPFAVAPTDEAARFAFETGLEYLQPRYQASPPFGCHRVHNLEFIARWLRGSRPNSQYEECLEEILIRSDLAAV